MSSEEETRKSISVTKTPKIRHSPYSKPNPILLSSDRRSRKRKSLTWKSDEKEVRYFELIADERINVHRQFSIDQQIDANSAGSSSSNANNKSLPPVGSKISNASVDPVRRPDAKTESNKPVELAPWRPLILIDFIPEIPSPGWNSIERSAQAERETYVLGAIDLPGQASTLDEPDQQIKSNSNGTNSDNGGSKNDGAKIIPIDNPGGMTSEYPSLYESEIVNGVLIPTDNPQPAVPNMSLQPFCNQQSQMMTNQFQQPINPSTRNSFNFQDIGAFQQAQMQIQYPFSTQQPMMPFHSQQQPIPIQHQQLQVQQQQQSIPFDPQAPVLAGPITPWLNYPFNQANENSHAHLFRRPAT